MNEDGKEVGAGKAIEATYEAQQARNDTDVEGTARTDRSAADADTSTPRDETPETARQDAADIVARNAAQAKTPV
jgi:hypothetical protein